MNCGERGQTTFDFAIGMSLFVLAVAGVLFYVPALFSPFAETGVEALSISDRAADQLVGTALVATPATPNALDTECTTGFFDADGAVPSGCQYTADGADLPGALGLPAGRSANVSIIDPTSGAIHTLDVTRLATGPSVAGVDEPAVAQRVVLLDGQRSRLTVRVW